MISRITRAAIATHTNIKEKRTSINKSLYRYRERVKRSTQSDLGLSHWYQKWGKVNKTRSEDT